MCYLYNINTKHHNVCPVCTCIKHYLYNINTKHLYMCMYMYMYYIIHYLTTYSEQVYEVYVVYCIPISSTLKKNLFKS